MRKTLWLVSAAALALAACQPASDASQDAAAETAAVAADASAPEAASADAMVAPPSPVPMPVARIAYSYRYALSLPRDRGAEMMSRHELTCAAAGPSYCQVISARAEWAARVPGGVLELRGQPEWIDRFRSGLAADAHNAGGRLEEAVTEGEDVTRQIDGAQTGVATAETLEARIRALQARSGGTAAQRLEIERQLAELMRQRDEQQVALRDLQSRVQSARLTLDYRPGGAFVSTSPTRPVAQALADAFGLSMGVLGVLITLGAALLPIALIAALVCWASIRRKRKPIAG